MQRAFCWFCAACGIATKAFGLFLQPHPWITLINLGLRADRSAAGKGWGFGTASRAVDQLGTQLEPVSGQGTGCAACGRKCLGKQGLILQRAAVLPYLRRGCIWGCFWSRWGPLHALLGQDQRVQQLQGFAEGGQKKCYVLEAKQ